MSANKQPRIGEMQNRITLQSPQVVTDDYGNPTTTWISEGTVWARALAKEVSGTGGSVAERMEVGILWQFDIRYFPKARNNWQVLFQDKTLLVLTAMDRDGDRKFTHLTCEELQ